MSSRPATQVGLRRHREARVLARASRPAPSHVAALVRLDVAPQQRPLGRRRRRLLAAHVGAARGQVLLQRRARALQRAVDRRDARLEQRRPSPSPTSRARRAGSAPRAARRQVLDRDQEGELDRLLRDDARRPAASWLGDASSSSASGIRLQPRDLDGCADRRRRHLRRHARGALERVQAGVGRDPVQPRAERRARPARLARCARRAGTSPAPGPRSPRTSRASGSSAPAARAGGARRAR